MRSKIKVYNFSFKYNIVYVQGVLNTCIFLIHNRSIYCPTIRKIELETDNKVGKFDYHGKIL